MSLFFDSNRSRKSHRFSKPVLGAIYIYMSYIESIDANEYSSKVKISLTH